MFPVWKEAEQEICNDIIYKLSISAYLFQVLTITDLELRVTDSHNIAWTVV